MKKRLCEKCGEFLPEKAECWKTFCYKCWRKENFGEYKIKSVMARLGENNIVKNKKRKW